MRTVDDDALSHESWKKDMAAWRKDMEAWRKDKDEKAELSKAEDRIAELESDLTKTFRMLLTVLLEDMESGDRAREPVESVLDRLASRCEEAHHDRP